MLRELIVLNSSSDTLDREFDLADYRILTEPKGRAKIYRSLEKTPFNFNVYVLMSKGSHPLLRYKKGLTPIKPEEAAAILSPMVGKSVQDPTAINILFTNNITGLQDKMPFNAWTMAHRLGHGLSLTRFLHKGDNIFDLFERTVIRELSTIFNQLLLEKPKRINPVKNEMGIHTKSIYSDTFRRQKIAPYAFDRSVWNDSLFNMQSAITLVANAFLTMKSARDRKTRVIVDIGAECLAQYIITGRVRLNRTSECNISTLAKGVGLGGWPQDDDKRQQLCEEYGMTLIEFDTTVANSILQLNAENLDPIIEQAEKKINKACKRSLQHAVGKFITM